MVTLSRETMQKLRGGSIAPLPSAGANAVALSLNDQLPFGGPTIGGAIWSIALGFAGKALWDYGPEAVGTAVEWIGQQLENSGSNSGGGYVQPRCY